MKSRVGGEVRRLDPDAEPHDEEHHGHLGDTENRGRVPAAEATRSGVWLATIARLESGRTSRKST